MRISIGAAASVAVLLAPGTSLACSDTGYIGSICMTAGLYCPMGTREITGQQFSTADDPVLFSLIGTVYGGDGHPYFLAPDARGREPVGQGTGKYPDGTPLTPIKMGERRGYDRGGLWSMNLPVHTHSAEFSNGTWEGGHIAGSVNWAVSATHKLSISAELDARIGTQAAVTNQSAAPGNGSILAKARGSDQGVWGVPISRIDDDTAVGPDQSFGGQLSASATLTSSASATLPVIVSDSAVVALRSSGKGESFVKVEPQTAIRFCMYVEGIYPPRP